MWEWEWEWEWMIDVVCTNSRFVRWLITDSEITERQSTIVSVDDEAAVAEATSIGTNSASASSEAIAGPDGTEATAETTSDEDERELCT